MVDCQYKVWDPASCGEDEADQVESTCGPDDAAQIWVGDHHADFDYSAVCDVLVRDCKGKLWKVAVSAEETVVFTASEPEEVRESSDRKETV